MKGKELSSKEKGESSEKIRARVIEAREIQVRRFNGRKGLFSNADMQSKDIREYCRLDAAGEELLKMAITKLGLSARAYDRILKVGRTIADMAASADIRPEHIGEAIQYSTEAWIEILLFERDLFLTIAKCVCIMLSISRDAKIN